MKKIMAILAAVLLMCCFAVSASALTVYDDEVYCEYECYGDGLIEFNYEFPENSDGLTTLWAEFYIFPEDEVPENVIEGIADGSLDDYRIRKTATDDQFLSTSRWVGGSYDEADCVYQFKTGVTYHIYFAACNGQVWWFYSKPLILEYTESEYVEFEPTPSPVITEEPTKEVTAAPSAAASQNATKAPEANKGGFPVWGYIVIGVVVVAAVVVAVVVAVKKKKAE